MQDTIVGRFLLVAAMQETGNARFRSHQHTLYLIFTDI